MTMQPDQGVTEEGGYVPLACPRCGNEQVALVQFFVTRHEGLAMVGRGQRDVEVEAGSCEEEVDPLEVSDEVRQALRDLGFLACDGGCGWRQPLWEFRGAQREGVGA